MKKLQCLIIVVGLAVSFFIGINTGVSLRLRDTSPDSTRFRSGSPGLSRFQDVYPDLSRLRPVDPPCTCVPCLPDLFCMKCRHKSRDCPKLAAYFAKRGGSGGVNSSNSVPFAVHVTNQPPLVAHE